MKSMNLGRPRLAFRRTTGGWWDCEVTVLSAMIKEHKPIPYIAAVLDRNIHSVHTKIKILKNMGKI